MNILSAIKSIAFPELASVPAAGSSLSTSSTSSSFQDAIGAAIAEVESTQQSANTAAANLLANGQGDIHTVALASQRAELSMELFQQVRNKFVQAYQEVMKMPM